MKSKPSLADYTLNVTDGKHGDCINEDNSGYYFLSVKDLKQFGINYSSARQITEKDFNETHKRTKLEVGDILLANSGHTIGKMIFVKDSPHVSKSTFQKSVAIIKPDPSKINGRYLYYYLLASVKGLRKSAVGSAQPNLLLRDLRDFEVNINEDPIHQAAVSKHLSDLDEKIEINNDINSELEEMANNLFDYWFVQFDFPDKEGKPYKSSGGKMVFNSRLKREIPVGWSDKELSEISNITMGQSPAGSSYNSDGTGTIFFQGSTDFGWLFPSTRQYTTAPNRMAEKGDLLVSVRAPVGTLNIAKEDCCIGRGLAALKSKKGFDGFLFYVMKYFKQIFDRRNAEGTTFGAITKDDLHSLALAYPTENLLKKYDDIVSNYNKMIFERSLENIELLKLRDWLLPMFMNGQVKFK